MEDLNEIAHKFMREKKYSDAIKILEKSIIADKTQWNVWYLLGQCFRFTGEYNKAIDCLDYSIRINSKDASLFLALGIVYQLVGKYDESLSALRKAIILDDHFILAYNSAGMTLKLMGNFNKSIDAYKQGIKSLALTFIKNSPNKFEGLSYPHFDTQGTLHNKYLLEAALYASTQDNIDKLVFPTSQSAVVEYENKTHGGLLWADTTDSENKKTRNYLPNFFMAGLKFFITDNLYPTMLGNLSTVLNMSGQSDLAKDYLNEAHEFKYLYENSAKLYG